jgi:hypothetical protein
VAVKLHCCSLVWVKIQGHPCWKVEKALQDMGVEYERVPGPLRRGKRDEMLEHTGQKLYPAIEFDDGTWYREESQDMEKTIRGGTLMERARVTAAPVSG